MTKKTCSKCKKTKGRKCFNRDAQSSDGRQSYCRVCSHPESPIHTERVPMAPLAALIRHWSEGRERGQSSTWDETGWISDLAKFSGVSTRRIRVILAGVAVDARTGGPVHHVSFRAADALVTAMDMVMEWHNPLTLGPYYGPLNVKAYERHFEQPLPEAEYAEELEAVA